MILVTFLLVSGVFNLYTNYLGNFCRNTDIFNKPPPSANSGEKIDVEKEMKTCHDSFTLILSIVNKKNVEGKPDTEHFIAV